MEKEPKPKLRLLCLLLCAFVGVFGVHRFYVGKMRSGIAQILLTIFGFVFALISFSTRGYSYFSILVVSFLDYLDIDTEGILLLWFVPVSVWVLVDFLYIVCGVFQDADGKPVAKWMN